MSKRSATELSSLNNDSPKFAKASGSGLKREISADDEMGEFEDAWEDEIESDEDVVDNEAQGDENGVILLQADMPLILSVLQQWISMMKFYQLSKNQTSLLQQRKPSSLAPIH